MNLASASDLTPTLVTLGAVVLGGGGVAGILTALATRRNYITSGFRSLTDASAADLATTRAELQRAEGMSDRWREAYWAVRYEAQTRGVDVHTPPAAELPPVPPQPMRQQQIGGS